VTVQNKPGQIIGNQETGLSPLAQAMAKAPLHTLSLSDAYGKDNAEMLGVGGPAFHQPNAKEMEDGRM
jgi:hypothetical protein